MESGIHANIVTGGSGFLGNLIARRLLDRGESVRILDIWQDPSRPAEIDTPNATSATGRGWSARCRESTSFTTTSRVPLTKSGRKFWEVNVEGTRIAAETAVKAGVSAFIHMSSSAIFGTPNQLPINHDTLPAPVEIYGRGKLAGERAARDVLEKAGLPLIVIRPRTILGEGRLGIFQILFEWIREGRNVYTIGDGQQRFQFVHAHDLMDFYMLALDVGKVVPTTWEPIVTEL